MAKLTVGGRTIFRKKPGDTIQTGPGVAMVYCGGGRGWIELVYSYPHERSEDVLADYHLTHGRQRKHPDNRVDKSN